MKVPSYLLISLGFLIGCILSGLLPNIVSYALVKYPIYDFIRLVGSAIAYAGVVTSNNCAYMNTMEARFELISKGYDCVYILVNEEHVRYVLPDGKVIDPACRDRCDDMVYLVAKACRNTIRVKILGTFRFKEFIERLTYYNTISI